MLRHALRRNTTGTDVIGGTISRKPGLNNGRSRFQTTGKPKVEFRDNRNSKYASDPNRRSNRQPRRPDFLQSLRVQTNPLSNSVGDRKPRESSNLVNLLRQGPNPSVAGPESKDPFPEPPSATQSTLPGLANQTVVSPPPGLVHFFERRMQEVRQNERQARPESSSSLLGRVNPAFPSQQSPISGSTRKGMSLQAALREARIAQRNPETGSTSAGELSTIRQVLDKSPTKPSTQSKPVSTEETMSPIRQYVAELQKKNRQKREEQRAQEQEAPVPSWRKSAKSFSQNHQHQRTTRPEVVATQILTADPVSTQQEKWEQERMLKQNKKQKAQKVDVEVVLPSNDATIADLSLLFRKKVTDIIKCLEGMGECPTDGNYLVDVDMAEMVAMELDIKFTRPKRRRKKVNSDHEQLMERRKASVAESAEDAAATEVTKYTSLPPRPPVVCIMGHVDHGKTTLMDSLRRRSNSKDSKNQKQKKVNKTTKKGNALQEGDVAGTESGGITQQISAFQVPLGDQKDAITFLDTPGHAAFSAMRQSGSHAADIIVLVIAADDGVSPQTVEILNFYKSIVKDSDGGISMVVAMNKIDKPGIDVAERRRAIENQLLEHDIVTEGIAAESKYGSPVQLFPISAKTGEGLDDLIEGLALQSEVMDLRADDKAMAEGVVMDARVEQGLGVVADCIIRWGSIEKGDVVVSNTSTGKVRILKDINDKQVKKGLPSQPVRIVGFKTIPKAGDALVCVASEKVADDLVERRIAMKNNDLTMYEDPNAPFSKVIISGRESMTSTGTERRLQRYDLAMEDTGPIRIPIVVKAKADGSVAAVRDALKMLGKESSFDINVDPIAEGVGMLTQGEIEMAKESNAAVFCFDIKNQDKTLMALAEAEGVAVHEFDVIYSLLDHAKEVFTQYLPPMQFETIHGKATVQAVFSINNDKDIVAGLRVLDGHIYKSSVNGDKKSPVRFRVIRDGERISPEADQIRATSLKKFKDDVESVRHGEECGLSLSGDIDFKEGDVIECYTIEMRKAFSTK